jgi:hypothetical protein
MPKKTTLKIVLIALCLFTLTSSAQAAQLNDPYSSLVSGLDKINSSKFTAEAYSLVYDGDELVSGTVLNSKGVAMQTGSTTFDSSSSIVTTVGDSEESFETKMDFIRKGDDIYIKFKYGPAKNKWIRLSAKNYEDFGEAIDMELEFKLADMSDQGGKSEILLKKLAKLAEKHDLFVNFEDPVTKKKKGKTLTTYLLEYDRDKVLPFFTEANAILTEEEKEKTVLSVDGFIDSLKSRVFVDSLVEESFVEIVFDEATGLPVQYAEKLLVPEHKAINLALEQVTYMKFDNINKKVTIKVPAKSISSDDALKLMGLDD